MVEADSTAHKLADIARARSDGAVLDLACGGPVVVTGAAGRRPNRLVQRQWLRFLFPADISNPHLSRMTSCL